MSDYEFQFRKHCYFWSLSRPLDKEIFFKNVLNYKEIGEYPYRFIFYLLLMMELFNY